MKKSLAFALTLVAGTALAADTVPYIVGTAGITPGNVLAAGTTVGEIVDGGTGGSGCTVSGGAGAVFNNGSSACTTDTAITATAGALSLGSSGVAGTVTLGNGTSGTAEIKTATGALSTTVLQIPAWQATGNVAAVDVVQTFSASQTFGETHGTTYAPSFTSNNYAVLASDCGKTLLIPTGTTPTVTMPNLNAACTVTLVQASAVQFTVAAASGGTIHSVNSYTKSKAQYAMLFLTIIVPSATVAEWSLAGDGA